MKCSSSRLKLVRVDCRRCVCGQDCSEVKFCMCPSPISKADSVTVRRTDLILDSFRSFSQRLAKPSGRNKRLTLSTLEA